MLEPLPNIPPPEPANPNAGQTPIQNVKNSYSDAIKSYRKDIVLFVDNIPRGMEMKDINSKRGGRIHLKSFPGAKSKQLNHYVKPTLDQYKCDSAIVHVGINDILRCKNKSELEELPTNIKEIGKTCQ